MWFSVVCPLIDNEYASSLFSQTFFSYWFSMLSKFAKVFERKVWHVQVAHQHSAARALSSRSFQLSTNLDKDWYCSKKHIECGLAWSFSLIFSMINYVYLLNPIKPLRYISSITKIKSWMSYFNFPKISKWNTDPYKFLLFFVLNGCEACNSVCIDSSTLRTGNSLY